MKCNECEYFKVLYPPLEDNYDSGMAKCEKHDLVVDWFSKQNLNKLVCIKECD